MSARLVLVFVAASCFGQQPAGVRITWIGQSCFFVRGGQPERLVVIDPPAASTGYTLPPVAADVVTVSHNHTDHNYTAGLREGFALVDGRGITTRQEVTAAGLDFTLIPSFHDNQGGAQRGLNAIVRWTQGGLKLAHLGDLGQEQLTPAQAADLEGLDVMFVPAGGFFTIDAARAAALVAELKPRVAILMHFQTALGGPAQLATFPAVAAPFSAAIRYQPADVTLTPAALPASTEVWLMEVSADAAVVNAATRAPGVPVAPGSLAWLLGSFPGAVTAAASDFPLPRRLGEVELLAAGKPAPLYEVSPGKILFQVPGPPEAGQRALEARVGGTRVARGSLTLLAGAPGLFAVLNQDGRANSPANPARCGQVIQIFATGQGEVVPAVEDGAPSPSSPPALSTSSPEVYLEGRLVAVRFSGLAPGLAGVWQVNAVVPQDTPAGPTLSLALIHGLVSNSLTVAVE